MSANEYAALINTAKIRKADRSWFPRWIYRYASSQRRLRSQPLGVAEQDVIRFLRSLRDHGTPAWQRLQAARAVESYRNLVLKTDVPTLYDICRTLERAAADERVVGSAVPARDQRALVGRLDPKEPPLIRAMRAELRLMHYSRDTERGYTGWVKRFIRHCGSEELAGFGENEIREFLTDLAVVGKVAAKTQDQALAALLFLYQKVMRRELAFIDAARSKKPVTLPVVLSRREVERLIDEFHGRNRLIFRLLYGSGLQHREALRLRVKDICFDQRHLVVRNAKGEKDRITVLPGTSVEPLTNQIEQVRRLHTQDLDEDNHDIRTVQELLGHKDVATTMIYTHVMNRPGIAVKSPVDTL